MNKHEAMVRMYDERRLSIWKKTMSETGTVEDRALDDAELDAMAGVVVETLACCF